MIDIRTSSIRLLAFAGCSLTTVFAVMWWRAPNPTWACESDDTTSGCVSRVALDLSTVDSPIAEFDDLRPGFRSFALSPDGTRVAVGFHTQVDDARAGGRQGGFVAEFETRTGISAGVIYSIESPETAADDSVAPTFFIESMAYSPDGSLLAFSILTDSAQWLQVVEVATQTSWEILRSEGGRSTDCIRLGFSPDNRFVQCAGGVFTVTDGSLVELLDNENRFADYSSDYWAWARNGITAEMSRALTDEFSVGDDDEFVTIARDDDFPLIDHVSFDPTTSSLFRENRRRPQSFSSRFTPHRRTPPAKYQFFDPESGELQHSFLTDADLMDVDWNEAGDRLATLDKDLTVALFTSPSGR